MPLLSAEPPSRPSTLAELVGIAHTVETEAIRRYSGLAEAMRRRGETATAEAFEKMAREEAAHVAAVEGWAGGLGQSVPEDDRFRWRLPADLAESWREVAGSALLTPYRAYAVAVDNEQRAFAFYAYLAATADDARIAQEAEALAREELRHAALLRTWRRAAWHRQRHGGAVGPGPIESSARLAAVVGAGEAEAAACHRLLAGRLRSVGDPASAALLAQLADEAEAQATVPVPPRCDAADCRSAEPAALLLAAQRPLETLCEVLETVLLAPADEQLQRDAQEALARLVARIARLGRRMEALPPAPDRKA